MDRIVWMIWPEDSDGDEHALNQKKFDNPGDALRELLASDEEDGLYTLDTMREDYDDLTVEGSLPLVKNSGRIDLMLKFKSNVYK